MGESQKYSPILKPIAWYEIYCVNQFLFHTRFGFGVVLVYVVEMVLTANAFWDIYKASYID